MVALVSLVCALFLVCRSTHRVVEKVAYVVEAYGKAQLSTAELMTKQQEFTTGALIKFHEHAWRLTTNKELHAFVRTHGLAPFMNDPGSMVEKEIEATQMRMGLSREQTIDWMRSRYSQDAVATGAGNGEVR